MRVAKLYAVAVTTILLIVGGYRMMFVEAGVPTHWPSAMRFKTGCLTSTIGLTQSFQVTADTVAGITVLPAIAAGTTGQVLFELRDGPSSDGVPPDAVLPDGVTPDGVTPDSATRDGASRNGAVRHKSAMPIADLATDASFTVKIPPVAAPANGRFTLWIGRSDDSGCLAFHASAVSAPEARLTVGGREVLGDLLFQVHADRATALDEFQRWLAAATRLHLASTVIAVLALVYSIAIGVLCWMLTAGATGTPKTPVTPGRAAK